MASAGKKETVKSLSDKVTKLTKELKDYNLLKKKVHELEKKLESFENVKKWKKGSSMILNARNVEKSLTQKRVSRATSSHLIRWR